MPGAMMGRRNTGPNITIDSNLDGIEGISFDQVPQRLGELGLTESQEDEVWELVVQLKEEMLGGQNRARLGDILERFKRVSRSAYDRVGKPLFLQFLKRKKQPG